MIKFVRNTVVPMLLILCCTPFVMIMWHINTALDGSLSRLFHVFHQQGLFTTIIDIWAPLFWGSTIAWQMIAGFITFQFLLLKILPGKRFYGPLTPKGYTPVYKANGVIAFIIDIPERELKGKLTTTD